MDKSRLYRVTANGLVRYFSKKRDADRAWIDAFLDGAEGLNEEKMNKYGIYERVTN